MGGDSGAAGLAALSVCESILLSPAENEVSDAAEARAILEGGNSVRHAGRAATSGREVGP